MNIQARLVKALAGASLLLAGCGPTLPTGLELVGKSNPPTFKLSGDAFSLTLKVRGPFPSIKELQADNGLYVSIWEINTSTTSNSRTPIEDLPPITYGVTPRELAQYFPHDNQKPVSLAVGKFYKTEASATHAKSDKRGGWIWERSTVCFTVLDSGIDEVDCFAPGTGGVGPGN